MDTHRCQEKGIQINSKNTKNILIVKLSALGDVVQAIPTFEALRRHYPKAHISWLVEEEVADLLIYYPGLDELLVSKRPSWWREVKKPSLWPSVFLAMLRLWRRLRRNHYDIIIDLQGLLKSAVLVGAARGRRKIGFEHTREESHRFLNEKLPAYDPDRHALERYLDVARYLGAQTDGVSMQMPWNATEAHGFRRRLGKTIGNDNGPLIAFHPLGSWPSKLWSEDQCARLVSRLTENMEATVICTGSVEDRHSIWRLIRQAGSDRIFNWAGTTSLRELAFLYRQANLVISTDSGPMHLAAALGTPVVALFGPTAPWRTGPYGDVHTVIWAALDCSPCYQRFCDGMECMTALSVNQVFTAVTAQLGKE